MEAIESKGEVVAAVDEAEQGKRLPFVDPAVLMAVHEHGARVDTYLEHLVNMANEIGGFGASITVHVGGSMVAGTLIGGREYFRLLSETIAGGNGDKAVTQALAEGASVWGEKAYCEQKQVRTTPNFIHLKDVVLFVPGGAHQVPVPLWRGRLCKVDGFVMGKVTLGR
ncbi:MAG: hypothetical protein HY901_35995 [Deltaproteobacteria bacterium]|nr:hypothetical protein [Deltaproteobacteria bacterium]